MLKSIALIASLVLTPFAMAQTDAPPPMAPGGGMPSPEQIFGFLDADKDGFIAKEEAKGPLAEHFDKVDSNQDGKVSPVELQTAMAAMRPPEPTTDEPE